MRVLVVASEYHRRGGFPRYAAQIASGLRGRGHEVTVLTRREEVTPADSGLRIEHYRCPGRGKLLTMIVEPWVVTRAVRRRATDFDAVLVVGMAVLAPVVLFGTGTHRGFVDATLSSLSPRSWRWWFERARPFHRIVLAWERWMLRRTHPRLIVVGAEAFRREYLDLYGFPEDRVVAVPLAVERDEFTFDPGLRDRTRAELGLGPSTKVLLNVAGRGRQKGLDVLLEALDRLPPDLDVCTLLAGGGSAGRRLASAAGPLVHEGRVRLLGPVDDVRALYCAADLLVFPSRYDPWGLVVTEALSCGLPVAASSRAGASTAVRPSENGVVIDEPTDPDDVVTGILSLCDRDFDREAVAATVDDLSVERMAARLEVVLREAYS